MTKKPKNKKIMEWKADKRAQRKADEHIPKAMKDADEKESSNHLQKFKLKKKEQKYSQKIAPDCIRMDDLSVPTDDDANLSKIVYVPPINDDILKFFKERKKVKENKKPYIREIPSDVDKCIISKYRELVGTTATEVSTIEKLIKDLKHLITETSVKNASDVSVLNESYGEFLRQESIKTNIILFEEKFNKLNIQASLDCQTKESGTTDVIPNKDSFKEAQRLIKSLVESYTEFSEKTALLCQSKEKIRGKTLQLKLLADREESVFESIKGWRSLCEKNHKYCHGNLVTQKSIKLLSRFRDQMIQKIGKTIIKNSHFNFNGWIKKFNKFILTERRYLSQIKDMSEKIFLLQDTIKSTSSEKVLSLLEEEKSLNSAIREANESFEIQCSNSFEYSEMNKQCRHLEAEMKKREQAIQCEVEKLNDTRSELANGHSSDKKLNELKNVADIYEEKLLKIPELNDKIAAREVFLKRLKKRKESSFIEQSKKVELMKKRIDEMLERMPSIHNEILLTDEFNRQISLRLNDVHFKDVDFSFKICGVHVQVSA